MRGRWRRHARDRAGHGLRRGTLLSAVAYELVPEASFRHGVGVGAGFLAGALAYYVGDRLVDQAGGAQRQHLDGKARPAQGIAGTVALREAGYSDRRIFRMWTALIVACGVTAAAGFLLGDAVSHQGLYAEAFAGGAVLTMLADSMMPEAMLFAALLVGREGLDAVPAAVLAASAAWLDDPGARASVRHREHRGHEVAQHRDEADRSAAVLEGLGHHRVREHRQHGAAGERLGIEPR